MGILLCYDVTSRRSLDNISNWVRNIAENAPQTVNRILVGNKCDMSAERQVSTAQGEELAQQFGMTFFETSARSNLHVSEAFETLATDVVDRLLAAQGEAEDKQGVDVDPAPAKSSLCC
uniref:Uncharacterized protein n=2 Tax=Calcidiscus leptoporus TaxID=127549 RepID=A0A7S0J839_9EUKA|mmetsp:Transcript_42399/g.99321  ORF Transcript_42399/g.99321 Transcript_42399/m.99321 type:complete len:119 (+) Transcript_42399:471-827(+)